MLYRCLPPHRDERHFETDATESDMTANIFAVVCFVGFVLPIPLLAWLDKLRATQAPETR